MKRLLRRCRYPRCWTRRAVEAVLAKRTAAGDQTETRAWFCDLHADHLSKLAMRGAERVRVFQDDDEPIEFLGFEQAVNRLALERGWSLRQARRHLEREREKGRA